MSNRNKIKSCLLFLVLGLMGIGSVNAAKSQSAAVRPSHSQRIVSSAVNLISRIKKIQGTGIMIGHQDDPVYGHNWKWDEGKSDIKDVVCDYPAVMGFELGGIELDSVRNLDGVPFSRMRKEIIEQYQRGGVIELSWHAYNPVTGKTAWDSSCNPVKDILKCGKLNNKFQRWLDKVAMFLKSLKTVNGQQIPVIFRPWHEMSGGWFWWGTNSCTPQEYKQLYIDTYNYMARQKLTNLVWTYSPNGGCGDFMKYYPGDKYIDMLGIDIYDFDADNAKYQKNLVQELDRLQQLGREHKKLIALTETGAQQLPDKEWFTKVFWPVAKNYPISYVLFWRNAWDNPKETYMTYPGHTTEKDFCDFAAYPRTLFVKDIKNKK